MLEERTTIERWARSQITRIDALRNALKAMGRESYEGYLVPQLLQPFYYFGGGWKPEQPPVVLRISTFIDRAAFRDMMEKLKLLGFKYTGNGTFEGEECEEVKRVVREYGLVRVREDSPGNGSLPDDDGR